MGVTGLWRLIEPAGKPVPVETLENKVLAVDISIWLHQMVKGYQDAKGAPLPNAHLMGLFQRLCKLLYFRIKPVFVFDGAFPELKKETIAKRQDHKAKYNSESERIKRELALLLSKKTAVSSLLGKQISPKKGGNIQTDNDDIFKLPALPQKEEESESESDDEQNTSGSSVDINTLDVESDNFKKLSVKEKYDLLIELKETRKMNSWGKLHELPKKSDSFSDFQLQRLLKRKKVQDCLAETEKEMGDAGMSLNDLESLLNEEGIDTRIDALPTRRIASNVSTRFLLIKDVKQALADAKKRENDQATSSKITEIVETESEKQSKTDELESDMQKAIKLSLECDSEAKSSNVSKTDDSWTSCLTDTDYSDSEEDDGFEQTDMTTAKAYIMQYSDFTHKAIENMVTTKKSKNKQKIPKVDEIIDEINKEKSVIVDNVDISSSDDDYTQNESNSSEGHRKNDVENLDEHFDATQSSVICIGTPARAVVNLDSSLEEIENSTNKETFEQNDDLEDEELQRAIQMSLECIEEPKGEKPKPNVEKSQVVQEIVNVEIKQENDFSDNEFDEMPKSASSNESDSSDNEFEDVPETEITSNKPIVELTLNMGDAPEDDIFADVFEERKADPVTIKETDDKSKAEEQIASSNHEMIEEFKVPRAPRNTVRLDNIETQKETPDSKVQAEQKASTTINAQIEQVEAVDKSNENMNKLEAEQDSVVTMTNTEVNKELNPVQSSDLIQASNNSNTSNPPKEILTTEKLNSLVEEMQNTEQDLLQEKGRLDRVGRNITEQMTKEAQELLQIFGIPYIVAPMEAEAQCAFLESVNLTDGTITDDSDIWLFGGRTVYKNFFNQKKHVLQFQAERIETSFNLNREQLVLLALLVGSDYTTGVSGVGPVTALEILASFPFNKRQLLSETTKQARYTQIVKGLQEFKQWVRAGKRTDNTSLKKKLKNVALTEDFPSVRVVQAYLEPNIEKSEDKFTWGELDITILRDYTKTKFGWSQNKLDEIIKPVIKRMIDRKTQRSVQDFFKRKVAFQSLEDQMSKRVKAAVQRMGPEAPLEGLQEDKTEAVSKPATKRKATKSNAKNPKAGPSAAKQLKKTEEAVLNIPGVKEVSEVKDGKSEFDIKVHKSDRYQEIIPQREKDKKSLLENKLKAIELFRKTNIDKKRKNFKRRALQPKDKAELSESDSD